MTPLFRPGMWYKMKNDKGKRYLCIRSHQGIPTLTRSRPESFNLPHTTVTFEVEPMAFHRFIEAKDTK